MWIEVVFVGFFEKIFVDLEPVQASRWQELADAFGCHFVVSQYVEMVLFKMEDCCLEPSLLCGESHLEGDMRGSKWNRTSVPRLTDLVHL